MEEINESYLVTRREYEQQQQSVVKEILGAAGILVYSGFIFFRWY